MVSMANILVTWLLNSVVQPMNPQLQNPKKFKKPI